MAISLYDEIQSLLTRTLEQSPIGHAVFTQGKVYGTAEEGVLVLFELTAAQGQALLRIARKVDELEAAASGG